MAIGTTDSKHYTDIADNIRRYSGNDRKWRSEDMAVGVEIACSSAFDTGYRQGKDEGFDEGMTAGRVEGRREGYDSGKADGITEGIETGKTQEYWRFWNSFQQDGNRRNYPNAFSGSCWKDETYNPPYDIIVTNMAGEMFKYNSVITTTKVPITIDTATASTSVFIGCTRLVTIPSIKVTDKVTVYTTWFSGCTALTNITFTDDSVIVANISFQDSPLNKASTTSVVNALSSTVTGKTATFKKTAKEAAFTADEWSTLIATKSNWTFSLV